MTIYPPKGFDSNLDRVWMDDALLIRVWIGDVLLIRVLEHNDHSITKIL